MNNVNRIISTTRKACCASLLLMGLSLMAYAAESPQVMVQSLNGLSAGALTDGKLIAQGRVIYSESHQGFRVWHDGELNGQAHRYRLRSARGNPLDIRLTGKGWQPDTQTGRGVIVHTTAQEHAFEVEVDGAQTLPVDTWVLKFNAVVLEP